MATMERKLKPFQVPNYAIMEAPPRLRSEGFVETPTIPLRDLPAETLAAMCDDFRAEVFRKAGKPDPATR